MKNLIKFDNFINENKSVNEYDSTIVEPILMVSKPGSGAFHKANSLYKDNVSINLERINSIEDIARESSGNSTLILDEIDKMNPKIDLNDLKNFIVNSKNQIVVITKNLHGLPKDFVDMFNIINLDEN